MILLNRLSRKCAWFAVLALVPTIKANWVVFGVSAPGENALVAEQIRFVPGGGGLLDYEFLVDNVGPLPINGFFMATGVPGGVAAALAAGGGTFPAGDKEIATAADAGNGPFPAVGAGGAFNTPLAFPFEAGATNPFSPVLARSWGFEQFDDGAGGPPATYYTVGWFDGGLPPLPVNFFTRFDLFSNFGPVAGFGGIDPFAFSEFGIVDINPGGLNVGTISNATTLLQECGGNTGNACDNGIPGPLSGAQAFGAPEPKWGALMVMALAGLMGWIRKPANGWRIFRAALGRVVLLAAVVVTLPAVAQLTVNPLGGLPNRPYVIARAVSNANPFVVGSPAERVAGEASTFPVFQGTPTNAGFWDTPNGVVLPNPVPGTVLSTLTGFNGSYSGQGISGSTRIAGYALQFGTGITANPTVWIPDNMGNYGAPAVLPSTLGTNGRAYGINDSEQIVGYVLDSGNRPKALRWENPGAAAYGNATILGVLPADSRTCVTQTYSTARGISNTGLAAGDIMSCSTKFFDHAVMWEKDTTARDLNGTALTSVAFRVANTNPVGLPGYDIVAGTVNTRVGGVITTSAAAWQRPVNGSGNPTGLFVPTMLPAPSITVPAGFVLRYSAALGVNNFGTVVGVVRYNRASPPASMSFGVEWTFDNNTGTFTAVDLNTLLEAGSGFVITEGDAINDTGDILAVATMNGARSMVLLTEALP